MEMLYKKQMRGIVPIFLIAFVVVMSLNIVSAYPEYSGLEAQYFQNGSSFNITQLCSNATYNNITSIVSPTGFKFVFSPEVEMTEDAETDWTYEVSDTYSSEFGYWKVNGHCDPDGRDYVWMQQYEITPSGHDSEIYSWFSVGLILFIFGIGSVFLFLSGSIRNEVIKVFFIFTGLIFVFGGLLLCHILAVETNMRPAITNTITALIFAFGLIFFVVMAYILINATRAVLELMRRNKGYELDF